MLCHNATDWHQAGKSAARAFPLQIGADDCDGDIHDGQLGANAKYAEVSAQHRRYSKEFRLVFAKGRRRRTKLETHVISLLFSGSGVLHLCAVRLHSIHRLGAPMAASDSLLDAPGANLHQAPLRGAQEEPVTARATTCIYSNSPVAG